MARMGPMWVCTRSSPYVIWLLACYLCETHNNGSRFISDHFASMETYFLLLGCFALPSLIRGLSPCLIVSCFVMSDSYHLKTWSFLERKQRGRRFGYGEEGGLWDELGEMKGGEAVNIMYCLIEEAIFSNKKYVHKKACEKKNPIFSSSMSWASLS